MTEKFVGYFRFLDACDTGGCPLCRCVADESRARLDALLYEQITDPDTRRVLRDSWGFCNRHTWMLLEIDGSRFGSAILYEDLARRLLQHVRPLAERPTARSGWRRRLGRRRRSRVVELYRGRRPCTLCAGVAEAADRYLAMLVEFVDDADLRAAYARSDGLCAPHMLRALELGTGEEAARELLERTLARWAKIREDLARFVEKHDHRGRAPVTEAEAESCRRAFEMLAGAPGAFRA